MMPDITMCLNHACTQREKCFRYKAKPKQQRQAYFLDDTLDQDGTCEFFWEMQGYSDNLKGEQDA